GKLRRAGCRTAGLHVPEKCSILSPAMTSDSTHAVHIDSTAFINGSRKSLFGLDADALSVVMKEMNEPAWRGRQVADALYRQWIEELSSVTTLPADLR